MVYAHFMNGDKNCYKGEFYGEWTQKIVLIDYQIINFTFLIFENLQSISRIMPSCNHSIIHEDASLALWALLGVSRRGY